MVTGKIGEAWVDIQANMTPFNRAVAGISQKLKAVGARMQSIGRRATMGLTVPIVGVGGAATKMSMDFEEALTRMESLVGLSQSTVAGFKDEIEGMAGEVGKSPKELAEAMFFITSAGLRGSNAMDTLRASAKASASGLGEVKTIADAATSAMNAYGAENLSASDATSVMIASVREGKLQAEDLANSLGQVIPVASQLGISFEDVGAQMAAMSRLGLDARRAATAMRGLMRGLVKPSDQAKKQLEEVGLSVTELRRRVESGNMIGVLQDLKAAFEGNSEAMANVFPRIRGLIGAMSLTGENADKAKEIMSELKDTAGATGRAFGDVADKDFFKAQQATSKFQTALTKLGESVKKLVTPVISQLADMVSDAAETFNSFSKSVRQKIVKGLMGLAAIGPVLIGLGAAIASLGAVIGGLGTAFSTLISIGPILAGIFGSLSAAVAALWDKNKTVTENITNLWQKAKKGINIAIKQIAKNFKIMWGAVKPILISLGKLFKEIISQVATGLVEGVDFSQATKSMQGFRSVAKKLLNNLSEWIGKAIDDYREFLEETNLLKKATKVFGFIASKAFQNFISTLKTTLEWINSIMEAIDKAIGKIETLFNKLPGSFTGAMKAATPITAAPMVADYSEDIISGSLSSAIEIKNEMYMDTRKVWESLVDTANSTL